MNASIIFALLSLVFAGINDVIFKMYSMKDRSRGMYVFGIGLVWTLLQIVTFGAKGINLIFDDVTLGFGLLAGLFLTISNILLIESLTHIDVSLGSTIYRLNTIGVVILSVLLLREPLGMIKCLGIVCGIIGVQLLCKRERDCQGKSTFRVFFMLAVMASLLRAAYGVSAKAGILLNADTQKMVLLMSSSWMMGGVCYARLREKRFTFSRKQVAYSLCSGILVFLIVYFLMLALELGQASIVIPVANMSFIIALTLSVAMKMEVLNFRKFLAILFAVGSIILLSKA
jgi:uncharacterized membrane protein